MRTPSVAALCLCLAAVPALARGMFDNDPPGMGWGRSTLQTKVQSLVASGRKVAAAHALFAVGRGAKPQALADLMASGNLDAKDLATPDILRPDAKWHIFDGAGVRYAEVPLAVKEANTPECREVNRQAGPYPSPQFSCVETPEGVMFRYRL